MNTLFYSRKGGQGKTTHAVAYARHSGAHFLTFDYDNGTRGLYEALLPEGHFHEIPPTGQLVAYAGEDHVFDFGGYLDERIIKTAAVALRDSKPESGRKLQGQRSHFGVFNILEPCLRGLNMPDTGTAVAQIQGWKSRKYRNSGRTQGVLFSLISSLQKP